MYLIELITDCVNSKIKTNRQRIRHLTLATFIPFEERKFIYVQGNE